MGQSPSSTAPALGGRGADPDPDPDPDDGHSAAKSKAVIWPVLGEAAADECAAPDLSLSISDLPDECLACVFQYLGSGDRARCSLVCRRWLAIEGQSRQRLALHAQSELLEAVPALFARFDSVTKLALKCDRKALSIGDEALVLISLKCRNLTRLKLRGCRALTDTGIAVFTSNCRGLRKLSCGSCAFGAKGLNAVIDHCASLEELSVKRLRSPTEGATVEPIGPGAAAASLKTICLKELYNGQGFGPLIIGSKNLRTLKLVKCYGDWDTVLQVMVGRVAKLVEIHLERIQVSDFGIASLSNCSDLEILHLLKTPHCTNLGLISVAERCTLLRKLHIDGLKLNRIGDDGLIAVAKRCPNLRELVLIGVNPTELSLDLLGSNCGTLERLAFCGSDTVGDAEIMCIAVRCVALKKLCIKNCPVSDEGMKALASGCPNLVKLKVKKCGGVTSEGAAWLRMRRVSLALNLDSSDQEQIDAFASDGGGEENHVEFPPVPSQTAGANIASSSGTSRSSSFKSRLGSLRGKSLMACTFRRWSSGSKDS
ncbi:hypothetical protein ACJRO7_024098 [Eucalyptus globulus]|uniref:F-box domain-containing protein n=1 Tax=Eucalyptus globulus TaxID=34317 RepID=A0ABD3K472_EUCGL